MIGIVAIRPFAGLALAAALAIPGCTATSFATQPGEMTGGDAGPADRFENGVRVLSCVEAVAAAERSLEGLHWPISTASFVLGVGNCPRMPTMQTGSLRLASASAPGDAERLLLRCGRVGRATAGTVTFTFWFGEPVRKYVALDENGVAVATDTFADVEDGEAPPPGFVEP